MTDLPLLVWSTALSVPVAAGTAAADGAAEDGAAEEGTAEVGADPYPDPDPDPDPDEVEGAAAGVVGVAAGVLLVPQALIPATAPVSAVAITMVRKDFTVGLLQRGSSRAVEAGIGGRRGQRTVRVPCIAGCTVQCTG